MQNETLPDAERRDALPHTLEELQLVDRRTQGFTPWGLGGSHILTPESTVSFQHDLMAAIVLADAVPDNTRKAFDQVRSAFIYGALNFDLFTLAEDRARLLMELAFRDRFMTYYATGVPVRDRAGATTLLTGDSFHDITGREVARPPGRTVARSRVSGRWAPGSHRERVFVTRWVSRLLGDPVELHPGNDDVVQWIEVAADLVHFRGDMRRFLAGVHEAVVAEAILVVVMLAGDALRDRGARAVMLRLHRPTDRRRLRMELTYRPDPSRAQAHGYRELILDQISDERGVVQDGALTTIWAEFALIPPPRSDPDHTRLLSRPSRPATRLEQDGAVADR